jgi:type IV pilus assembly protein PilP
MMTTNKSRLVVALALCATLVGCGEGFSDLRTFVKESEKNLPRKIEALPQVKPFTPFSYEGFDLPDPFKPRKLAIKQENAGANAPDLNRRKEPLEAFPLEQLKMVGTLNQSGVMYALVRAERTLYQVKKGNYLGQNFGLIGAEYVAPDIRVAGGDTREIPETRACHGQKTRALGLSG